MSESRTVADALDHVVVVLFENRSFDNVLGHCTALVTARRSKG
jgi:phospholipase C